MVSTQDQDVLFGNFVARLGIPIAIDGRVDYDRVDAFREGAKSAIRFMAQFTDMAQSEKSPEVIPFAEVREE